MSRKGAIIFGDLIWQGAMAAIMIRIAQILLIVLFVLWSVAGSLHGSMFASENAIKSLDHYSVFLTALATVAVAAFTGTLWLATDKLREAGDRQAELTKILERAYISAEPRGIHLTVQRDRLIGHIGIRNAGKLPASNLSWFIDMKQSNRGDEEEFPVSDTKGSIIVVPGATAIRASDNFVPAQQALDAVGTVAQRFGGEFELPVFLYVWGIIRYSDGFNMTRTTKFCHRYNWIVRGRDGVGPYEIAEHYARFHEHGNGAT
jgi:hypothetical protein